MVCSLVDSFLLPDKFWRSPEPCSAWGRVVVPDSPGSRKCPQVPSTPRQWRQRCHRHGCWIRHHPKSLTLHPIASGTMKSPSFLLPFVSHTLLLPIIELGIKCHSLNLLLKKQIRVDDTAKCSIHTFLAQYQKLDKTKWHSCLVRTRAYAPCLIILCLIIQSWCIHTHSTQSWVGLCASANFADCYQTHTWNQQVSCHVI